MTVTPHPFASTLQTFDAGAGGSARFFSLPELARQFPRVQRLPVSLRIVLESVLRHCDGQRILAEHVRQLANWGANGARTEEIPFVVARVLLQDFTGVPLLVDLAAMRSAAARLQRDPQRIEPLVPVDLVVDHSIMVDYYGSADALTRNMQLEFERNHERYRFMKWGMQAFHSFRVVPPGFGICHQVNLEYLARGVHRTADGICYPDTLVGTDSHTTMINGVGVVGWGVGGIEAEAAMLGQPLYFLAPDVVGLELHGRLREGVTATDLVLTVTELLRRHKVVGKFVEFLGEGARTLSVPDRATLGNMSPENGATITFFPVDDKTIEYFRDTGRTQAEIDTLAAYYKAQGLYGIPDAGALDYSTLLRLDLDSVRPSIAGPRRPQDRIELGALKTRFTELFSKSNAEGGFNQAAQRLAPRFVLTPAAHAAPARHELPPAPALVPGTERHQAEMVINRMQLPAADAPAAAADVSVGHGDVLIAAITSCTNTSNPSVMLAAGLLARKAVQAGLRVAPHIKTSLAPGSRVVSTYLERAGLLPDLAQLGFDLVGYGCTTCIGNSGDLSAELNAAIAEHDLVCAAVLSGNRNFEARIHPNLKANFLTSPPLVVAYALAGSVLRDLTHEPLGRGHGGKDIYLRDIWPSDAEVQALLRNAMDGETFRANYARIASDPGPLWSAIEGASGQTYGWSPSTYIAEPPYFEGFALAAPAAAGSAGAIRGARIMALFGDSITTDHISPAGSIAAQGPAGQWLQGHGVARADFNSYGSRRGHHEVMMRGTFANVRIKNLMLPPRADGAREEGGLTLLQPSGEKMPIYDAAMRYQAQGVPTVVFAGEEYGNGSSRDWAAKGTQLLGIKAVVARSFERIHRSNLVGMGVLPLQFQGEDSWASLALNGSETVEIVPDPALRPRSHAQLIIQRRDGSRVQATLTLRIDTPVEADYYRHGGILPYVLRQLLAA